MNESEDNSISNDDHRLQMSIVSQLFRATTTMGHIDELFSWLAYTIVQRLDVQLMQIWTNQASHTGQFSMQLRAMVHQSSSLSKQIVVNDQIALAVQRMVNEKQLYNPQPVEMMFSSYQATLLKRYGLNYCGGCFLSANILLPPSSNIETRDKLPTPLTMATLLFLRQPHLAHQNVVLDVDIILDRAIAMAGSRGLLLPALANYSQMFTHPHQQEAALTLEELIPRRKQEADVLLSSNPFASSPAISDKKARRLHAAIDGRTTIAVLCEFTGMNMGEVYTALQTLLALRRVELYTADGRSINASLFFKNR